MIAGRTDPTRRQMLVAGGATAAGAALASLLPGAGASPARAQPDPKELAKAALTGALRFEQTAIVAYEAIANSGVLGGGATAKLRELLDQDRQHADQLTMALDGLGQKPPIPPRRAEIPGLARVTDRRAAIEFAIALESHMVGAYTIVVRDLSDANVTRTAAGAMGTDAQHLVILRELAGMDPVPSAFERGARP
jgi:rubrerythrin